MRFATSLIASALVLAGSSAPASAQDVELLAERYGTRLPQGYFQTLQDHPDAFRFQNGRPARMRQRLRELGRDGAAALAVDPALVLGPRDGPVTGIIRVPVVLGLFTDSPVNGVVFTVDEIQQAFFSDDPGSITSYYREVSLDRVELLGDVQDWTRSDVTRLEATGGESGLFSNTVGPFIVDLLDKMPDVDWGLYDNDGPDGVPNSGDDDGIVDALTVVQPTPGAECGGLEQDDRVWSHRWALRWAASEVLSNAPYVTQTPAAGGGFIQIDDYTIQPVFDCDGSALSPIGVFTHELGHAFGLPDLYDTDASDGKHAGAGNWELMATGSWGCDGRSAESPCHMSAWSKAALGWADVVTVDPGTDLGVISVPPVETTGLVYRVDAQDGSGEYFLLENRQPIGFDQHLYGEGLLIWHIDPSIVAERWPGNRINAFQDRGVWLREADGTDDLGSPGGGRGDRGDVYPFVTADSENRAFHAASRPAARGRGGEPTGLTVVDIARDGSDVRLRLLTRFTGVTVRSDGDEGKGARFLVDGAEVTTSQHSFTSAPFLEHTIVAPLGTLPDTDGVRQGFLGWMDDPGASRARDLVTPLDDVELMAGYGGRQVELEMEVTGSVNEVSPGTFVSDPVSEDLWFSEGADVTLEAIPVQGFGFLSWSGALEGQPNPATITMVQPLTAGADFEFIYAVATTTVSISAAVSQDLVFEPDNGTAPYQWALVDGVLPTGTTLSSGGRLSGAAMETGSFPLTLEARDALGLTAMGQLTLVVEEPVIAMAQLASAFLGVGPPLLTPQATYLDREGNRNGGYDLGDLREWVLANPGLPATAAVRVSLPESRTVRIRTTPLGTTREGGR